MLLVLFLFTIQCAYSACGSRISSIRLTGGGSAQGACVLDRIGVSWCVSTSEDLVTDSNTDPPLVWLGLWQIGEGGADIGSPHASSVSSALGPELNLTARIDLYQYGWGDGLRHTSPQEVQPAFVNDSMHPLHSVIYSSHLGPSEAPEVAMIEWGTIPECFLRITFTTPTNAPRLPDVTAINNAVSLRDITLMSARAEWEPGGTTIKITGIDDASWMTIVDQVDAGTFAVEARKKRLKGMWGPPRAVKEDHSDGVNDDDDNDDDDNDDEDEDDVRGVIDLRLAVPPGQYVIGLMVGEKRVASTTEVLSVYDCEGSTAVLGRSASLLHLSSSSGGGGGGGGATKDSISDQGTQCPTPFFTVSGVLTMRGFNAIQIPHSSFPAKRLGAVKTPNRVGLGLGLEEGPATSVKDGTGSLPPVVLSSVSSSLPSSSSPSSPSSSSAKVDSWSMAYWILLLEPPTGEYRTLFYKGNVESDLNNAQRTPSAWLRPDSNKLALRYSTGESVDSGVDTFGSIPVGEWCHIAFTFENSTTPTTTTTMRPKAETADVTAGEGGEQEHTHTYTYTYTYKFYLNGVVDTHVRYGPVPYARAVLANENTLRIGADPSNPGPPALIAQLHLWAGALSDVQVEEHYRNGRSRVFPSPPSSFTNHQLTHQQPFPSSSSSSSSASIRRYYPASPSVVAVATLKERLSFGTFDLFGKIGTTTSSGHYQNSENENDYAESNIANAAFWSAEESTQRCGSYLERIERYRVAAEAGHALAMVRYASLLLTGREEALGLGHSCGRETEDRSSSSSSSGGSGGGRFWLANRSVEAAHYLVQAVELGEPTAAWLLAVMVLSGLGGLGSEDLHGGGIGRLLLEGSTTPSPTSTSSSSLPSSSSSSSPPPFMTSSSRNGRNGLPGRLPSEVGAAAGGDDGMTSLGIGLLHLAAQGGVEEAAMALGWRYLRGYGVERDIEAANFYLIDAALASFNNFHSTGQQPLHELTRLSDETYESVQLGQRGEDDDMIQWQMKRAEEGHLPSILAMGDLCYWGARGVERNHARALEYYGRAAEMGNNDGRCAAAGMYMKGEGTVNNTRNHTLAIDLYETAAAEGSTRALTGLGFEYFHGGELPQNRTKAYELFQRSADIGSDPDAMCNAGHCLMNGLGTPKDEGKAAALFYQASHQFGHFDSAFELGKMYLHGKTTSDSTGPERNPNEAVNYLLPAAKAGRWGGLVRAGFNCFLEDDMDCAAFSYAMAAELSYEVAGSNVAYLLDNKRLALGSPPSNGDSSTGTVHTDAQIRHWHSAVALRYHVMSAAEGHAPSFLALGDAFYFGLGGVPKSAHRAAWWYSRAANAGIAKGSYNMGFLHEHGYGVAQDFDLALLYYSRVESGMGASGSGVGVIVAGTRTSRLSLQMLVVFAKLKLRLHRTVGAANWPFRTGSSSNDADHGGGSASRNRGGRKIVDHDDNDGVCSEDNRRRSIAGGVTEKECDTSEDGDDSSHHCRHDDYTQWLPAGVLWVLACVDQIVWWFDSTWTALSAIVASLLQRWRPLDATSDNNRDLLDESYSAAGGEAVSSEKVVLQLRAIRKFQELTEDKEIVALVVLGLLLVVVLVVRRAARRR